eukprot:scaffold184_cov379-Prasinococcus_capsulatus_cf.AAC.10
MSAKPANGGIAMFQKPLAETLVGGDALWHLVVALLDELSLPSLETGLATSAFGWERTSTEHDVQNDPDRPDITLHAIATLGEQDLWGNVVGRPALRLEDRASP